MHSCCIELQYRNLYEWRCREVVLIVAALYANISTPRYIYLLVFNKYVPTRPICLLNLATFDRNERRTPAMPGRNIFAQGEEQLKFPSFAGLTGFSCKIQK